jgi:ABC-type glycerol-3-phosphate transport system substrate-binding protein
MPTATPDAPLPMRFALWTIEAVSAEAEGEAGEIFGRGLEAFEDTYPDVTVAVALKNESGKGGILDYLRTASEVSPSVLPDLVVLSTTELAQAARSGLVVPLEDWISPALVADLLPAARQAATVDGQLVGIPFEMDLEHLIYNTNKLSATPITWTDVISSNTTYVFPAKGRNGLVNDSFLVQYLALNGRLQDDDGRPWLDEQALRSVLGYYWMGVERGVIPPNVLSIGAPEDIWPSYVSAEVGIVHVTSHHFLRDRGVLRTTQFAAIPTRDGTPLTIARGRALAVVTRVPERQAVAARLIEFFMAPDNNAAWNQTRAYLPTRYAAFSKVGQDDPYWPFLQQQLEVAVPPPAFPEYDQIGRVLQQSVVEVLSGEARPEDAAAAALDAIVP